MVPQCPVAGRTVAAPVFETPFFPSPLSSAPIPGTWGNMVVRPKNSRTQAYKHFVIILGSCPVGDACNFIHDAALPSLRSSDQIRNERGGSSGSDACAKGPWSTNNTAMVATQAHRLAHMQEMCMDLRGQFLHPKDLSPYVAYTPYFRWPNCVDGPYCVFRVPIHVSASTCALALATPFDRCKGAPSQIMGPRCLVKHPLCQVAHTRSTEQPIPLRKYQSYHYSQVH
ncbi:hypothetical protein BDR05DRAFT_716934 [Suillus weaverae]|nr:hypothetical protein BDR05DRAFT_716934 [Suillus weaverae]